MVDPAPPPSPRRYVGRLVLAGVLVVTGLALILTIGITKDEPDTSFTVPDQRPRPHASTPRTPVAAPVDRPDVSDQAELDQWSEQVSAVTDVPARALAAYGRAEMWMRAEHPDCHLSWGTLAGIGRVESRHGGFGGARIGADGTATRPIIGVPLDGSPGVQEIRDTDGGRLDGDTAWDRAVGPLQFLPETWQRWGARAVRDGKPPDPQNIDDAALAAARFLCSGERDLRTAHGWWDAVLAYNRSVEYGRNVFSGADAYAASAAP